MGRLVDPEGRYLALRGTLNEVDCTLANIYCPNKNPIKYLKAVMEKLMEFKKGGLIMAGDFNFTMEPEINSTSQVKWTGNAQQGILKKKLH